MSEKYIFDVFDHYTIADGMEEAATHNLYVTINEITLVEGKHYPLPFPLDGS